MAGEGTGEVLLRGGEEVDAQAGRSGRGLEEERGEAGGEAEGEGDEGRGEGDGGEGGEGRTVVVGCCEGVKGGGESDSNDSHGLGDAPHELA